MSITAMERRAIEMDGVTKLIRVLNARGVVVNCFAGSMDWNVRQALDDLYGQQAGQMMEQEVLSPSAPIELPNGLTVQ